MAAWGNAVSQVQSKGEQPPKSVYDREYYRCLLTRKRAAGTRPVRMALVGKENTGKTGTAVSVAVKSTLCKDKEIVVLDCDSSCENTIAHVYPEANIKIIPILDPLDESLFDDNNEINWVAVVDKVSWFVSLLAEESENIGAVIFDGGSTFMKWCEFVMTHHLQNRSKNPISIEDGDKFNQAEWRTRNKVFKDIVDRLNALPVPMVFFTFHLKDIKEFMDIGDGRKGLIKVGEKVDWVDGTQRFVSQQLWLTRYTKKGDQSAGVKADKSLKEGEWVIRCKVEEMKGKHMEYLGKDHELLKVTNDGVVEWTGLPFGW